MAPVASFLTHRLIELDASFDLRQRRVVLDRSRYGRARVSGLDLAARQPWRAELHAPNVHHAGCCGCRPCAPTSSRTGASPSAFGSAAKKWMCRAGSAGCVLSSRISMRTPPASRRRPDRARCCCRAARDAGASIRHARLHVVDDDTDMVDRRAMVPPCRAAPLPSSRLMRAREMHGRSSDVTPPMPMNSFLVTARSCDTRCQ